jgi:hypothetical protein
VLTDAASLSVLGPLVAPNATLTSNGSIALPGAITTGTLDISANGTIVRPSGAGVFDVSLLTGNAVTLANFGSGDAITTLGAFVVTGSTLELTNGQPLTITGPLSAEYINIAATGTLTVSGTITTLGVSPTAQASSPTPALPGSSLSVLPGNGTPTIDQVGELLVQGPASGGDPTLRFNLPNGGGLITLNDLVGRTANIVLYQQTGGIAVGTVDIASLVVIGMNGSTTLTGFVNDTSGPEAARLADISPTPMATYRLNSCPIGTVNCVLIPVGTLPAANPLRDFVLDPGQNNNNDDDLALPDVSSKDY